MKDVACISYAEYEQIAKGLEEQSKLQLQLQAQLQALGALCSILAMTHPDPSALCEKYMEAMDRFADLATPELAAAFQPAMQEQLSGLIHIRNVKAR